MDGARRMDHDHDLWASRVIDLTGISLDSLPDVPESAFLATLRHILDEPAHQPETYLGFMSAFGAE